MKITLFDDTLSCDAPSPSNPSQYPLETRIIDYILPLAVWQSFTLDQIANVRISPSISLKLFGREIIFEVF